MSLRLTYAVSSITSESIEANAGEATNGVSAVGMVHVTVVKRFRTFINIYKKWENEKVNENEMSENETD